MSEVRDQRVEVFEAEVQDPHFSDNDAQAEFYTLAKGMPEEVEAELLAVLDQHRPQVATQIREELGSLGLSGVL